MVRPPFLHPGDTVGLIAPGKKVSEDHIHLAQKTFQSWGLTCSTVPSLYSNAHAYHSGSIDERRIDLQKLLDDPNVKAIVCMRGGYGTTQLLDTLNWERFKAQPKWIVGFSDVTALHLQVHRIGIESIHGIMPVQFLEPRQREALQQLKEILSGKIQTLNWSGSRFNRPGECTAPLLGGNLSLLVDSLATSNELHSFGHVLVIEEIDEPFYKLDRMLTQLKRAKKLDKIKGLIVGHFTDIKNTSLPYGETIAEIIRNKVNASLPVAFNFPSGHDAPNIPWIHGASINFKTDENASSIAYLK